MLIAKSLRPAVWRHRAVAPVLFVILMHVAAAAQISTSVCSSSALACEFQALVQGAVITNDSSASTFLQVLSSWGNPGDPQAQNKVPALVLQPSGIDDVVTAVKFAAAHNLSFAVKGGGNSLQQDYLAADGLTLDLSTMTGVQVDPVAGLAVVEGGANGGDIAAATQPFNLTVPWGDAWSTGMGLALAGGIGYSTRSHGLTTDNIISTTIVLANGSIVEANATHYPEILAATRGAGMVLGVVVSLTFQLFDVSNYYGGGLVLEDDLNGTVFRTLHEWTVNALAEHENLGVELFLTPPNIAPMPGKRIVELLIGWPGNESRAVKDGAFEQLRELPGIIEDTLGDLDYFELQSLISIGKVPYGQGVGDFTIDAIATFDQGEHGLLDMIHGFTYDDLPADLFTSVLFDYLGSTVAPNAVRNTTSYTPFAGDVDFHFYIVYGWPLGSMDAELTEFALDRVTALQPHVISPMAYVNLASVTTDQYLEASVGGTNHLAALRVLKKLLDPHNLISNHPFVGLWTEAMNSATAA